MKSPIGVIYFIQSGNAVKIGYATNFQDRLKEAGTWMGQTPEVIGLIPGTRSAEMQLHGKLKNLKTRNEQFQVHSKLFVLIDAMVEESKKRYGVGMNRNDWLSYLKKTEQVLCLNQSLRSFEMWQRFSQDAAR